jgi:hypothetical protein
MAEFTSIAGGSVVSQVEQKISVKCSHCGKLLKAPPSWIGKNLKCPGCGKTFTAKAGGGPVPAALIHPSRVSTPKIEFVEDRKGAAELKAMLLGLGLAFAGAGLGIGIWYVIGTAMKGEAPYFALAAGSLVGLGMYLGYRRADVAMGFLASMLALGTIITGKYVMYHAIADDIAQEFTIEEFSGPKAVAFQDLFEERSATLKEYSNEEDPEGDKMMADRVELRMKVMKEIEPMSDQEVRKRIIDTDLEKVNGYAADSVMTQAIHERGYAPDTIPGSAYRDASRVADARLEKMTPAEKKKIYYAAREGEIRPNLAKRIAELELVKQGKDVGQGVDPALLEEKTKLVAAMKFDDLIVQDRVVDSENWQLSISTLKDKGAAVATGLSFFSPRQIMVTLGAMGMAFTFATGGKFKE